MLARILSLLAPPLCASCGRPAAPDEPLCAGCERALQLLRPQRLLIAGADEAIAAAPYDGAARDLVAALKFGGRIAVAAAMAAAIARAATLHDGEAIVPVPPAPRRCRRRGFDPAHTLAEALAKVVDLPLLQCLGRDNGPRQVGRARRERLTSPPRIWAVRPAPERAVLVDDVVTTGATLTAGALALRGAGAIEVRALAFARSGAGSRARSALGASVDRA